MKDIIEKILVGDILMSNSFLVEGKTKIIEKTNDQNIIRIVTKDFLTGGDAAKKDEIKDDMKDIDFFNNIIEYDIDKELPFEDTIPIIQNLDLVITIDSAIVHLAGSLNINTILMLGYGSDWRWFDNEQELWYNSVELLRMKENIELFHILPLVKNKIELLLDSK